MAEPLTHRCALESTARARRWLVAEQPGAWGHDPLAHSGLDPGAGGARG